MMRKIPRPLWLALLCVVAGFMPPSSTTPYSFPEMRYFPPMPSAEGNPVTVEGVALGRYLFYDPILSADSTLSCGSCHRQEAAFSDSPNTLSKGVGGTPGVRNAPGLFNLSWHPSMFWDGRSPSIEDQVLHPVRMKSEMNLPWKDATERVRRSSFYQEQFKDAFGEATIDSTRIAASIAQFLRTLLSHRSRYDDMIYRRVQFTEDEFKGFELANDQTKGGCLHCHTTDANALGSTFAFSNNGLQLVTDPRLYPDLGRGAVTGRPEDMGRFKVPSLRNVALTAPYMHDGRFKTLEEVIDFYSEGVTVTANIDPKMEFAQHGGAHLTSLEKRQLLAFLHTLTDTAFVSDTAFANPWKRQER